LNSESLEISTPIGLWDMCSSISLGVYSLLKCLKKNP